MGAMDRDRPNVSNVVPFQPRAVGDEPSSAALQLLWEAVRELDDLRDGLAQIEPDPCWTAETWDSASMAFRMELGAAQDQLDRLAEIDAAWWPATDWALDLGELRAEVDHRLVQVIDALGVLAGEERSRLERSREFRRLAVNRLKLLNAISRMRTLITDWYPDVWGAGP
jgi:hypothetical protein